MHPARLVCNTLGFGNRKLLHIMSGADCLFSQTQRIGMFHLSSAAKLLQVDDGNCKSGIIVKVMLSLFEFYKRLRLGL